MNINDIAERAHNHAVKIGAYGKDSELAIHKKLEEESYELWKAIDDKKYCDIHNFWEGNHGEDDFSVMFDKQVKNSIGDEMADNIILLLAGAVELGIDIEKHIMYKQKYNELREDHK